MTNEAVIVAKCAKHFAGKGYAVAAEVPIARKVADLYCVHRSGGQCIAIEAKLRDLPRALSQALVYQLGADRVYVAMPSKIAERVPLTNLAAYGIGLLGVSAGSGVTLVLEAQQSSVRRQALVQRAMLALGAKIGVASLSA